MSLDLHLIASRMCTVNKTGKEFEHVVRIELLETPNASRLILASPNIVEAYCEWVLEHTHVYDVEIFADNDLFEEGDPIGVRTVNHGEEHIADLRATMAQCVKDGFEFTWYVE